MKSPLIGLAALLCALAVSCSQPEGVSIDAAISKYMTEEIAPSYAEAQLCIPVSYYVAADDSNPEDILVWGDFYVFNYNIEGDTLETISGGSHPGLMHLKKTAKGYEVTAFEQVGDGSDYEPTARIIFGTHYDDLEAISSDDELRDRLRLIVTSEYVKDNKLPVTKYRDYGWPEIYLDLQ